MGRARELPKAGKPRGKLLLASDVHGTPRWGDITAGIFMKCRIKTKQN